MKWVYRILLGAAGTLLICALSVLTTGVVVNAYVQSLLGSMNMKWEGQPSGLSSVLSLGWNGPSTKGAAGDKEPESQTVLGSAGTEDTSADDGSANSSGNGAGEALDASGATSLDDGAPGSSTSGQAGNSRAAEAGSSGLPDASQTNGTGSPDQSGGGVPSSTAPDNALPVMGSGVEQEAGGNSDTETPVVTQDELSARKDDIPSADKEEVFSMLMNKLPEDEMQKITTAMEGGLTESELINIQQILSKYLSKEDYAKILGILE